MYMYNEFGTDIVDIQELTAGHRVGSRIREIRETHEPPMTQSELGAAVGLSAARIQQYESGSRKPRTELLKKIAKALDVETAALADPVPNSFIGLMYTFFALEHIYGMKPVLIDDQYYLAFERSTGGSYADIQDGLKEWAGKLDALKKDLFIASNNVKEQTRLEKQYKQWEWCYPRNSDAHTSIRSLLDAVEKRIAELEEQAAQLRVLCEYQEQLKEYKDSE